MLFTLLGVSSGRAIGTAAGVKPVDEGVLTSQVSPEQETRVKAVVESDFVLFFSSFLIARSGSDGLQ